MVKSILGYHFSASRSQEHNLCKLRSSHKVRWQVGRDESRSNGKWGRIAKFLTPVVTEGSWSWHWYIPAVKDRQVDRDDSKARPWMLNLNCFIIFDTEEIMVISDSKKVKLRKLPLCWCSEKMYVEGNIFQWQCFEALQFLVQLQSEQSLGHQRHQLKDLNSQSKPFLSGPFLRLVCIWFCFCAWSSNRNVGKESVNLVLCFTWEERLSHSLKQGLELANTSQLNTLFYYPARPLAIADFLFSLSCLS